MEMKDYTRFGYPDKPEVTFIRNSNFDGCENGEPAYGFGMEGPGYFGSGCMPLSRILGMEIRWSPEEIPEDNYYPTDMWW